jgi:hypothetical protein
MKTAESHYDKGSTVPLAAEQKWHLNRKSICWNWGSHGSDFERYRTHYVVQKARHFRMKFHFHLQAKSRTSKNPVKALLTTWFCWFLSWLAVGREEGGDLFLCSVGLSLDYLSFATQKTCILQSSVGLLNFSEPGWAYWAINKLLLKFEDLNICKIMLLWFPYLTNLHIC